MNDITTEGAYRLAAAVLESAAFDYKKALVFIMKHRSWFEKNEKKMREYEELEFLTTVCKALDKKKRKTEEDLESIERRKALKKKLAGFKPTKKELKTYYEFIKQTGEKRQIEIFYKSDYFRAISLCQLTYEEVVKRLRDSVGYKE